MKTWDKIFKRKHKRREIFKPIRKLFLNIRDFFMIIRFPFLSYSYSHIIETEKQCKLRKLIHYGCFHYGCYFYDIPKGWRRIFLKFCKQLKRILKHSDIRNKFYIVQVKEKYGYLRVYTNCENDEIARLIDYYESYSQCVCIECGKPSSFITSGYVSYKCGKHFFNGISRESLRTAACRNFIDNASVCIDEDALKITRKMSDGTIVEENIFPYSKFWPQTKIDTDILIKKYKKYMK